MLINEIPVQYVDYGDLRMSEYVETPYRRQTLSCVLAFSPRLCDVLGRVEGEASVPRVSKREFESSVSWFLGFFCEDFWLCVRTSYSPPARLCDVLRSVEGRRGERAIHTYVNRRQKRRTYTVHVAFLQRTLHSTETYVALAVTSARETAGWVGLSLPVATRPTTR